MEKRLKYALTGAGLCYLWTTLTAGRNAARLLSGEFRVIAPWTQLLPFLMSLILFAAIYFAHKRISQRSTGLDPTTQPEPDIPPDYVIHRLISRPGMRITIHNISWRNSFGVHVDPQELEEFAALAALVRIRLRHSQPIDVTEWTYPGPVGPLECLLRWVKCR